MNEKTEKTEKAAKPKAGKKAAGKYVGNELKVRLPGGSEFEGLCTSERKIPKGGEQVFLKIKNEVSRWFNVGDIID